MRRYLLVLILSFLTMMVSAQENRQAWERYYGELSMVEDMDQESWQNVYDILSDMAAHPININAATREDLEQIPFLTEKQVEDINEYLYTNGEMKSIGELAMIPSLDYYQRKLLECIIVVGESGKTKPLNMDNIAKYGQHDITADMRIPTYTRRGDKSGYEGGRLRHTLRYDFRYGNRIRFGFVGSQDAGEPFFKDKNKLGYDHYSWYFNLNNIGRLKSLVIGQYRLSIGMGLVINTDLRYGKIASLSTMGRTSESIRPNMSRYEGSYLQGAAAKINIAKGLDVTAFASLRKMDGVRLSNDTISSVNTTGYHRTRTELERKQNTTSSLVGGNVTYVNSGFRIGLTGVYNHLSKVILPNPALKYQRYYPQGDSFWNVGIDYGYSNGWMTLRGETATGDSHALATINSLAINPGGHVEIMAIQRFYSYKYANMYANSFSDGGRTQNESGIYLGMTWKPDYNTRLSIYTDYAYFPWEKSNVRKESHSWDNMVQAETKRGPWHLSARYRLRLRQRNNEADELTDRTEHRGRLSVGYEKKTWQTTTTAELAHTDFEQKSTGWMISQNASATLRNLTLYATVGYFDADDSSSQLYSYERGILDSFSFTAFYDRGIRYAFGAQWDITRHLMLTMKVGTTDYFNRSTIGTGYETIDASSKTDIEVQARIKL